MPFKPGQSGNPEGRPVGIKNKYTVIKEMICQTMIDRQGELNEVDLKTIIKFISATSPKEQNIKVDTPIVVKWEDPKSD